MDFDGRNMTVQPNRECSRRSKQFPGSKIVAWYSVAMMTMNRRHACMRNHINKWGGADVC
jgi:hypothetical protein